MSSVRILRDKAKVRELTISEETVLMVQHIEKTIFNTKTRHKMLKDLLGFSLCLGCNKIPSIEVSYDLGDGFKKIEMYCTLCSLSLYQKERDGPTDRNEIAALYGCTIGKIPRTPGYDNNGKEILK